LTDGAACVSGRCGAAGRGPEEAAGATTFSSCRGGIRSAVVGLPDKAINAVSHTPKPMTTPALARTAGSRFTRKPSYRR
jgi:hypothetical protein